MSSSVRFNTANLWDDLKVLSEARSNGNRYLLCLYNGKLSSSLVPRDTQEAERSYASWTIGLASSITRTVGSYLWSNNDAKSVIRYLNELVLELDESLSGEAKLENKQVVMLKDSVESLENFADEYSAKEEKRIRNSSIPTQPNSEDNAKVSKEFRELADRIKSLPTEYSIFAKVKKT